MPAGAAGRLPDTVRLTAGLGVDMLQVLWREPRVLGDSSEHLWTDFIGVMEREDEIGPTVAAKSSMRPRLAL